jgi:hypothetical protein
VFWTFSADATDPQLMRTLRRYLFIRTAIVMNGCAIIIAGGVGVFLPPSDRIAVIAAGLILTWVPFVRAEVVVPPGRSLPVGLPDWVWSHIRDGRIRVVRQFGPAPAVRRKKPRSVGPEQTTEVQPATDEEVFIDATGRLLAVDAQADRCRDGHHVIVPVGPASRWCRVCGTLVDPVGGIHTPAAFEALFREDDRAADEG